MDKQTQETITGCLEVLKSFMKGKGLIFGIVADKKNPDNSRLAFIKKDSYLKEKLDGIQISLTELNKELM